MKKKELHISTIDDLKKISREDIRNRLQINFSISIPGLGFVQCNKIIRGVKGKRLICLAHNHHKRYIVKIFYHNKYSTIHWNKSNKGFQILESYSLQTPLLLYSGPIKNSNIFVMVFEYIYQPFLLQNITNYDHDDSAVNSILKNVMKAVAYQHKNGILQLDMNPGNYLIGKEGVYSIDSDHILKYKSSIKRKLSLKLLAHLLQKIHFRHKNEIYKAYLFYAKSREINQKEKDIVFIYRYIKRLDFFLKCKKTFKVMKNKTKNFF